MIRCVSPADRSLPPKLGMIALSRRVFYILTPDHFLSLYLAKSTEVIRRTCYGQRCHRMLCTLQQCAFVVCCFSTVTIEGRKFLAALACSVVIIVSIENIILRFDTKTALSLSFFFQLCFPLMTTNWLRRPTYDVRLKFGRFEFRCSKYFYLFN